MKEVYIVGAGGFGREVFDWMHDALDFKNEFSFSGFIDDNLDALKQFSIDAKITKFSDYVYNKKHLLICGIGNPKLKKELCEPLLDKGCEFLTIIHPTAIVGSRTKIGHGVVICPKVSITCDVEIGDMVMVNLMTTIGHDAKIKNWSTISAQCDITGSVHIEELVFVGSGARIIPNKKIGIGSIIGAGSVVIKTIKPNTTNFGNPARKI